jgi:hypothetical protein
MTTTKSPQGKVRPENELLGIYLNDHLSGATAGVELARRMAGSQGMPESRAEFQRLADEIAEDRAALIEIMATLGVPVRQYKVYLGWVAEKVGRVKPNGRLVGRSPLSDLVELESMRLGVEGKGGMWRVLRSLAVAGSRLDTRRLDTLIERAQSQGRTLGELHLKAAARAFQKT